MPRRLNSGDIRRLARSLGIVAFYDFPADFDAGVSVYGEMYIGDNAVSQTLTNQNQFYQWTTGWVTGENSGMTVAPASGTMTATVAGVYRVSLSFCGNTNTPNEILEFAIFKNGVYQIDHSMHLALPNNRSNAGAITGLLKLAAGDVLDVRIQNITSPGKTLVIEDANLSCS